MFSKTSKPTVPSSTYSSATQSSDQPGATAQRQVSSPSSSNSASSSAAGKGVPSLISSDLTIVGNLISSGDLQIDGKIEGDVESQSLTVGEGASVKGSLTASQVRISGRMEGVVRGRHVQLTRSAHMDGDLIHDDLAIEGGAHIVGEIRRSDSEPPVKKQAAPKAPETPKAETKVESKVDTSAEADAGDKAPAPPPVTDEKAAS